MKAQRRGNNARARAARIPTAQSLEGAALFYLGRYAASEFSLRRVLENRLRRAARLNPLFSQDEGLQERLRTAIDAIIERHKKSGALNDAAFAEMKTAGWRRAGRSARAIRMRLGQRGVARGAIEQALDCSAEDGDAEEAEFQAALALAKRRRLGPFRQKPADADQGRKDLATLARAGFSLDVARRALKA
jgi:regulatory protein